MSDLISEKLGIAPLVTATAITTTAANTIQGNTSLVVANTTSTDIEKDYVQSRQYQKDLADKAMAAIDLMMDITQQSQHPRSAEVLGQLLKIASEINERQLGIQKDVKKIIQDDGPTSEIIPANTTINVDKAVFTGTTSNLLEEILRNRITKEPTSNG